jgi:hypothetical protein
LARALLLLVLWTGAASAQADRTLPFSERELAEALSARAPDLELSDVRVERVGDLLVVTVGLKARVVDFAGSSGVDAARVIAPVAFDLALHELPSVSTPPPAPSAPPAEYPAEPDRARLGVEGALQYGLFRDPSWSVALGLEAAVIARKLLATLHAAYVVPAGSNTIVLRDLRDPHGASRSFQATVRSAERTELVLDPSSGDDERRAESSAPASKVTRSSAAARKTKPPSADRLYAAAERAMRAGQIDRASERLEALLAQFPAALNRDLALYDLALAAYKQRDFARMSALLERREREPMRPSLRALSAYLRCRAVHAQSPADSPACLADVRRRFPGSPQAREVLESDGRAQ